MALASGTRLGPYEIVAAIGAGGMGEVYRARDSKLDRDVAIKVLPEAFAADPDRIARFQREAKTLASLNHPHIAAIYGIEESSDTHALVMELVEGEDLSQRIARGPIPLDEALLIAKQIAEALEAAHEQGIIHRDLKPANIKVRSDGTVKVLDFGLAKLGESATSASAPGIASLSPTITSPAMMTGVGVLLGTAAYMSPEQAKGRPADKRADIWAFGVVLYEMVTGRKTFDGEDVSTVVAAVIQTEPLWDGVPVRLQRLLKKCLEKDPKRRLRDIGDVWELLDERTPASKPTSRFPIIGSASLALAAIALGVIFFYSQKSPPSAQLSRFEITTPDNVTVQKFAVSPDGRKIAFYATGSDGIGAVWMRSFDSGESRRLAEAGPSPSISWSPDSRFILFPGGSALDKLVKIDIAGGPPQTICEAQSIITGASWNSDGVIVFGTFGGGVFRVSASGGSPSPVTTLDPSRQENGHSTPVLLPDGRHFLYLRSSSLPERSGIYVGALNSKPADQTSTRLVATTNSPVFAPSADRSVGYLLFLRDNNLLAQTFNVDKLELVGDPVPIADHVGSVFEFGYVGVSTNGVLAYRSGSALGASPLQLTWFDRQGRNLGAALDPGYYLSLSLSRDITRAAVTRLDTRTGNVDVWLHDFARNTTTRFTSDPTPDMDPVWSSDGSYVAYASVRTAGTGLYRKGSNGTDSAETLLEPSGSRTLNDWSRDSRFLLYTQVNSKTKSDLWLLPLAADRRPTVLAASEFNEMQGQFSPDGRWVAYAADDSGRPEIYIRPLTPAGGEGGRWTVSNAGGVTPRWRRDGRELFFLAADLHTVMKADISLTPSLKIGIPEPLFKAPIFNAFAGPVRGSSFSWDVTPDGQKFLLATDAFATQKAGSQSPITIVLNWTGLLKK